jgi:hypothetical protein
MKALLFAALLTPFFADAAVNIETYPQSPIVIDGGMALVGQGADQMVLMGPWFLAHYIVKNDDRGPIVVRALNFNAKDRDGTLTNRLVTLKTPVEIPAGDAAVIRRIYVDSLSVSKSPVYEIDLELQGHEGTLASPGVSFTASHQFKTQ